MGAGLVSVAVSLVAGVLPLFLFLVWLISTTLDKLFDKVVYEWIWPHLPPVKRRMDAIERETHRKTALDSINKGSYCYQTISDYILLYGVDMETPKPSKLRQLREEFPERADDRAFDSIGYYDREYEKTVCDPAAFATEKFDARCKRAWETKCGPCCYEAYRRWLES